MDEMLDQLKEVSNHLIHQVMITGGDIDVLFIDLALFAQSSCVSASLVDSQEDRWHLTQLLALSNKMRIMVETLSQFGHLSYFMKIASVPLTRCKQEIQNTLDIIRSDIEEQTLFIKMRSKGPTGAIYHTELLEQILDLKSQLRLFLDEMRHAKLLSISLPLIQPIIKQFIQDASTTPHGGIHSAVLQAFYQNAQAAQILTNYPLLYYLVDPSGFVETKNVTQEVLCKQNHLLDRPGAF